MTGASNAIWFGMVLLPNSSHPTHHAATPDFATMPLTAKRLTRIGSAKDEQSWPANFPIRGTKHALSRPFTQQTEASHSVFEPLPVDQNRHFHAGQLIAGRCKACKPSPDFLVVGTHLDRTLHSP